MTDKTRLPQFWPLLAFLNWMERRGSHRSVRRQAAEYMERYYLAAVRNFKVFLHVFLASDLDEPHCHPWHFGRLILWGSYREWYHDGTYNDFGPGSLLLWRDAKVLHKVELLTPTAGTLFWHWRRHRNWGFLEACGWVEHPRQEGFVPSRAIKLFPRVKARAVREAA